MQSTGFTILLTTITLVAFAANSVICRLALSDLSIGPIEFTIVRLMSGLIILLPLSVIGILKKEQYNNQGPVVSIFRPSKQSLLQPLFLFGYALFFSLAYVQLDTATGALILFPTVQITMMGLSLLMGNRVTAIEWFGFAVATIGLIYLLLPGVSAPPLLGTALMIGSGFCWALYSLMGQRQSYPIFATARNFLYCIPGCIILVLILFLQKGDPMVYHANGRGVGLAILSGAVASAMGYILWYVSLKRITTTVASIAQLSVPIIAGAGGILFLAEQPSLRLIVAAGLIISGILTTIVGKKPDRKKAYIADR